MPKAKKLPSGNYRVQVSALLNGNQLRRSFTAPNAKQAENLADEWKTHIKIIGRDTTQMTVNEAIRQYIDMRASVLSPSTIREYERIYANNLHDLMSKKLYMLSCPMIITSINCALKTCSPKTVINRYSLLKHTLAMFYPEFTWAIPWPKRPKKRKRIFSHEYIYSILNAVKNTDFEVETYLGLLSMRESEVGGLKYSDIDFENRYLQISRTKLRDKTNKWIISDNTKTADSARIIYLPEYVCHIIRKRMQTKTSEFITEYVPSNFTRKLNSILRKHNVDRLTYHELRHIYSSLSAALGIDKQIRMENGGWSNEYIMEGTYQHSMSESQAVANDKINQYVNKATKNCTQNFTRYIPKRLKIRRYSL